MTSERFFEICDLIKDREITYSHRKDELYFRNKRTKKKQKVKIHTRRGYEYCQFRSGGKLKIFRKQHIIAIIFGHVLINRRLCNAKSGNKIHEWRYAEKPSENDIEKLTTNQLMKKYKLSRSGARKHKRKLKEDV